MNINFGYLLQKWPKVYISVYTTPAKVPHGIQAKFRLLYENSGMGKSAFMIKSAQLLLFWHIFRENIIHHSWTILFDKPS